MITVTIINVSHTDRTYCAYCAYSPSQNFAVFSQ